MCKAKYIIILKLKFMRRNICTTLVYKNEMFKYYKDKTNKALQLNLLTRIFHKSMILYGEKNKS